MEGYMCERSKHGKAVSTVLIENERTCVTEWRFKKYGDNTGWHRHEYDYIVVPLFDGQLEINLGTSENTIAPMKNGVPYFREVGVEHDVINGNDFECAFIEIEFLK
jgi:quercetin dioxygenase-like cupin family protein